MVLRPVDTHDHLKEVLHQCAMGPHKSWLLMITKEGYFKIDPSDMISGNTQRPYHRLIGLVESDLDKGSELETSYDDWQAVHIELGGFSEVRVRIDDKTENFLDLETAVSNTQGKTTSRSQILWVLHASLVEPCDKVLIAWNLLQAKGQPVWIKWKGRFGEPR